MDVRCWRGAAEGDLSRLGAAVWIALGVFLTWTVQSHLHVHCLVPFQHDSVVYLNFGLAVKDSKSLLISVLKAH